MEVRLTRILSPHNTDLVLFDLDGVLLREGQNKESGKPRVDLAGIRLMRELRDHGVQVGIIRFSGPPEESLAKLDLDDLIDLTINDCAPPETFQLAGCQADALIGSLIVHCIAPSRTAILVGSGYGVARGRRASIGRIIGVGEDDSDEAAAEVGADYIIADIAEVTVCRDEMARTSRSQSLPNALESWDDIVKQIGNYEPAIFLDYDGTLAPLVNDPARAEISDATRNVIRDLCPSFFVAIVSGRCMADIRERIKLPCVFFAGTHGFELGGPNGWYESIPVGADYLSDLDLISKRLEAAFENVDGVWVERKTFSVSVHFRCLEENLLPEVTETYEGITRKFPRLRSILAKKVFELRPNLTWHKGKAIGYLLRRHGLFPYQVLPIHIGDDVSDEDAFASLDQHGIGIVVRDEDRVTRAHFALDSLDEVHRFLEKMKTLKPS